MPANITFKKKQLKNRFEKTIIYLRKVPILPKWTILFIDIILCAISFTLSCLICSEINADLKIFNHFFYKLAICIAATTCFILIFHTHKGIFRFSTYRDIFYIFIMLLLTNIVLGVFNIIYGYYFSASYLPLGGLFVNFIFTFDTMFFFRMVVRLFFDLSRKSYFKEKGSILIYGTSSSLIGLCEMMVTDEQNPYKISGFISTDKNSVHKKILHRSVISLDEFFNNDKYKNIEAVLVNSKEVSVSEKQILSEFCFEYNIKLLSAPSIDDFNPKEIQKFNIEDLLGREPIKINFKSIAENLKGKNVLVTGAAGSIGSEIVRQLCGFDVNKLILCDIAETPLHNIALELEEKFPNIDFISEISDVRNQQVMRNIFEKYSPQYIYHAAAYKHVPMMEIHPKEAVRTNIFGTKIVADLAVEFKAECFVMISTDKAVNPSNVMGASKRAAEIYVRILSQRFAEQEHENQTRFIITRFGNVLGSNGSVVPLFAKQIEQGGPITVTHPDIIRYFMTIPEACSLVLESGNLGKGGEIFVFDMGEPVKIKDMAEDMIRFSGLTPYKDIQIEFTGLRQGEKLYEEILYENDRANCLLENSKIIIGKVRYHDEKIVLPRYSALFGLLEAGDNMSVVKQIKEIVPEFISQNSDYEVLDKKN